MPLPEPHEEAKALSQELQALIHQRIKTQKGWISFSDYMRMALYTPRLGYYSAGSIKLGQKGDFITAPEITPLFGMTLANSLLPSLKATQGNILELGAGAGTMAVNIMRALEEKNGLPSKYTILEISADLRHRQEAYIQTQLPHLFSRFEWLNNLPTCFDGVIIGNEVLDALPCHLIHQKAGQVVERGVSVNQEGRFIFQDQPLNTPALIEISTSFDLPDEYTSEVQLEAQGLITSLGNILQSGVILLIDYGFESDEYYHPERNSGTLICHYQHHMHTDPFFYPGLQDITTHIDFTAITRAALKAGLTLVDYTTQAQYLLEGGLFETLSHYSTDHPEWHKISQAVQILTHPAEMGEMFKVITFAKNLQLNLIYPKPTA